MWFPDTNDDEDTGDEPQQPPVQQPIITTARLSIAPNIPTLAPSHVRQLQPARGRTPTRTPRRPAADSDEDLSDQDKEDDKPYNGVPRKPTALSAYDYDRLKKLTPKFADDTPFALYKDTIPPKERVRKPLPEEMEAFAKRVAEEEVARNKRYQEKLLADNELLSNGRGGIREKVSINSVHELNQDLYEKVYKDPFAALESKEWANKLRNTLYFKEAVAFFQPLTNVAPEFKQQMTFDGAMKIIDDAGMMFDTPNLKDKYGHETLRGFDHSFSFVDYGPGKGGMISLVLRFKEDPEENTEHDDDDDDHVQLETIANEDLAAMIEAKVYCHLQLLVHPGDTALIAQNYTDILHEEDKKIQSVKERLLQRANAIAGVRVYFKLFFFWVKKRPVIP